MYRCIECEKVFSEPLWRTEYGEEYPVSPCCNCEDYEEVHECECGRYINEDEEMCEVCKNDTIVAFIKLLEQFDKQQLQYINEYYNGEEIR